LFDLVGPSAQIFDVIEEGASLRAADDQVVFAGDYHVETLQRADLSATNNETRMVYGKQGKPMRNLSGDQYKRR
jgi:hypothetical protein